MTVAALLKSATTTPPKPLVVETASAQDASPPPNHSPYFHVVGHVAKVTVDFGLDNCPLTPANLSRCLGERQREAQNANRQDSQDFGHKMFSPSKCVVHSFIPFILDPTLFFFLFSFRSALPLC